MAYRNLTAINAIKAKCRECTCFQMSEVKSCHIKSCPLWTFRNGRLPDKYLKVEFYPNGTYNISETAPESSESDLESESDEE